MLNFNLNASILVPMLLLLGCSQRDSTVVLLSASDLSFEETDINLPSRNSPFNHTCFLRNSSSRAVVIERIETSCGCLLASTPLPLTVAARSRVGLEVTVKTSPYGLSRQILRVYVSQPSKLEVAGDIYIRGPELPPPHMGTLPRGLEVRFDRHSTVVSQLLKLTAVESSESAPWFDGVMESPDYVERSVRLLKEERVDISGTVAREYELVIDFLLPLEVSLRPVQVLLRLKSPPTDFQNLFTVDLVRSALVEIIPPVITLRQQNGFQSQFCIISQDDLGDLSGKIVPEDQRIVVSEIEQVSGRRRFTVKLSDNEAGSFPSKTAIVVTAGQPPAKYRLGVVTIK